VRRSGAVQTLFTASKLLVLAILIVLGLTYGHGSWQGFRPFFAAGSHAGLLTAFGVATVSALWAYDGWNNLSMVAGEVKNPQRNVPLALIVGALLVLIVYVLVNLAYFHVLPASQVLGTNTVASDAARRFLGNAGGAFIAVGVMISTFATLNGSILAGSRIPYATAREGLFPAGLGVVHPRFHTPAVSLVWQAIIAGLFTLTGGYQSLYTKAIFSEFGIPLLRPLHRWSICAASARARPAAPLSDLGISRRSRGLCYSRGVPAGKYVLAATHRLHVGSRAGG
jgi:APA family basic amino acid/polyamine antiporter